MLPLTRLRLRQVHNRFVDSFKKPVMEQESRCVRGRIHERRKLNFACLVAMHEVRGHLAPGHLHPNGRELAEYEHCRVPRV